MANIKVNIDVDSGDVQIASDKVLTLQQQIKVLRQELQKTPEGTKEFNLLVAKLNDTRDAFDRVNIKGKEIFGTLGLIPGPIGEIAARTNSAIDALKIFGSFTVTDLKAQFAALGADFKGALVTLGKLTGITTLYTTLNNALAASFVRVGVAEEAAAVGARTFAAALTATGVGLAIVAIGVLVGKLMEVYDSYTNAGKAVEEFNSALQKSAEDGKEQAKIEGETAALRAKSVGKSEEEIVKIKQETLRKQIEFNKAALASNENARQEEYRIANRFMAMTAEEKKAIDKKYDAEKSKLELDSLQKTREIENLGLEVKIKAAEDKKKKDQEISDKAKALRDKDLEEIKKNAAAAQMAVLEGRTKELAEVDKRYKEQIALAKKYGKDTAGLEEARRVERKRINAKYDEDEYKTALEFAKKLADITVASIQNDLEQSKAAREEKYKEDLRALEADKQFIKMSEDAKNVYRQQLRQAADQDIVELEDKASQEVFDRRLKALQVENEGLVKGTQSYFDTKREIVNVSEQNELNDLRISLNQKNITTEEFEKQRAAIQAKYAQQRKAVGVEELNTYLGFASSVLGAINGIFSMASSNLRMQQEQDIANAEGNEEKIEAIKRKGFEDNKKIQIAQAIIGTLQSAVQSFQSLSVIPIVGPALGAAAAAAALVFGYKQVALIKAQQYKSSSSSGSSSSSSASTSSASAPAFSTPTVGAPQIGPTGAQEGTIAGIVAGSLSANNAQSRPIRAYVVGNDITSEQQLQRRIKTAARLGG